MKRHWFFLIALVIIFSFGCKQRVITQPEAQLQPPAINNEASGAMTETVGKEAPATVGVRSEEIEMKPVEETEGIFKDILFDYDNYEVKETYRSELKSIASWMVKNTGTKLSIEGHCDDRGTNEYNLALGELRAKAAKDFLVSLSVLSSRIEVISFGEEKPLCTEKTESCWPGNRRAHFVVLN